MEKLNSPTTVNFEITEKCNANCIFCSIKNNDSLSFKPLNHYKKLIDIFKEEGILRLNLFGGEPFIHPEIIEIVKYMHELDFYISGVSNGLAINSELVEETSHAINAIGISLHGLQKTHDQMMGIRDSYYKSIDALKMFLSAGVSAGVNMTVTSENFHEIKELFTQLIEKEGIKINFIALNRFIGSKVTRDIPTNISPNAEQLNSTLLDVDEISKRFQNIEIKYAIHFPKCIIKNKKLWRYIGSCGFGYNYCAVNSDGNIKMCSYTSESIGNVFDSSLSEIWQTHDYLNLYREENWLPYYCKKCKQKYVCMSGCKASSIDKPFGPDSLLSLKKNLTYDYMPFVDKLHIRKEAENKYLVLNKRGKVLKINEMGLNIIKLCDGNTSIDMISENINSLYDVSNEKSKSDTFNFIVFLFESGICQ